MEENKILQRMNRCGFGCFIHKAVIKKKKAQAALQLVNPPNTTQRSTDTDVSTCFFYMVVQMFLDKKKKCRNKTDVVIV